MRSEPGPHSAGVGGKRWIFWPSFPFLSRRARASGSGEKSASVAGGVARMRWAGDVSESVFGGLSRAQQRSTSHTAAIGASVLIAIGSVCERETRWPWRIKAETTATSVGHVTWSVEHIADSWVKSGTSGSSSSTLDSKPLSCFVDASASSPAPACAASRACSRSTNGASWSGADHSGPPTWWTPPQWAQWRSTGGPAPATILSLPLACAARRATGWSAKASQLAHW